MESVEAGGDRRGTHYWIKRNRPMNPHAPKGTDIWAVSNNRISITPLDVAFPSSEPSPELDDFAQQVASELGLRGRS